MTPREKIVDRVKKLLALAGKNPSREEAEAAALRAADLIERHKLKEAELEPKKRERPDFGYTDVVAPSARWSAQSAAAFGAIAEAFDCIPVLRIENELNPKTLKFRKAHGLRIAGTETDRVAALAVLRLVLASIEADLRKFFPRAGRENFDGFVIGMAVRLRERLAEQAEHIRAHSERALVRLDALASAERFVKSDARVETTRLQPITISTVAELVGRIMADRAELNRSLSRPRLTDPDDVVGYLAEKYGLRSPRR